MKMYCQKCDKMYDPPIDVCSRCGGELDKLVLDKVITVDENIKHCPSCHARMWIGAPKCMECGERLGFDGWLERCLEIGWCLVAIIVAIWVLVLTLNNHAK